MEDTSSTTKENVTNNNNKLAYVDLSLKYIPDDKDRLKYLRRLLNPEFPGKSIYGMKLKKTWESFGNLWRMRKLIIIPSAIRGPNIIFNEKIHRYHITGNPGIGKTVFGFYLLYLLSQQNKTIVYHKVYQYPILFNNQHTFCSDNISDFKGYLDNTDVLYIVDGQPPLQDWDVQSSRRNKCREFVLTLGGIPRFILEKAQDSSQQNHFEDAISKRI
ncbi:7717_t:CDS:2 [Ambispora gerdemannii]|uniref:7717_t:CDS:1 n=1 Tax=Ambispora gerdemannii TaxID=144530 RepID=A0A9N8V371_9GLOM|nr:7717_t:CDS:2 [Ambispora gerdemannii]